MLGTEDILTERYYLKAHGRHERMALVDYTLLKEIDVSKVVGLSTSNLDEITKLFGRAYPGNFFEPKMLETKQYFGIRESGELISIAGVHVYSTCYKVAALGNITTHPDYRNRGYCRMVTGRVCKSLLDDGIDHIGLNVKSDNLGAIRCYEKLGFKVVGCYGEFDAELKIF
jgi:predicted GNAT family acetyltransferase